MLVTWISCGAQVPWQSSTLPMGFLIHSTLECQATIQFKPIRWQVITLANLHFQQALQSLSMLTTALAYGKFSDKEITALSQTMQEAETPLCQVAASTATSAAPERQTCCKKMWFTINLQAHSQKLLHRLIHRVCPSTTQRTSSPLQSHTSHFPRRTHKIYYLQLPNRFWIARKVA